MTLTQLWLSGTAITDKGILQLKANNRIEHLYLDQTATNDATIRAMANWTTIKSLNLEYTQITDACCVGRFTESGAVVFEIDGIKDDSRRHRRAETQKTEAGDQ